MAGYSHEAIGDQVNIPYSHGYKHNRTWCCWFLTRCYPLSVINDEVPLSPLVSAAPDVGMDSDVFNVCPAWAALSPDHNPGLSGQTRSDVSVSNVSITRWPSGANRGTLLGDKVLDTNNMAAWPCLTDCHMMVSWCSKYVLMNIEMTCQNMSIKCIPQKQEEVTISWVCFYINDNDRMIDIYPLVLIQI